MLLLMSLLQIPSAAQADEAYEPPATTQGENAVGSCLGADQVWLFVTAEGGEVLANQCVGNPPSGEDALARGGMQIRFGKGRLICSLSGHPAQCPATFTGSYWNYHRGQPGTPYTYSKEGAENSRPSGGTIEAWCYNGPDEKACTPPALTILLGGQQILIPGTDPVEYVDPAPTVNPAVPVPASTPWALISTGVVIAIGVALVIWRRRNGTGADQVGGR